MSLFPKTSSFEQEPGPRVEAVTPRVVHETRAAVISSDVPNRQDLERWYHTLDGYLSEVGDRGLEDVRDEIYSYLH